MNDVGDLRFAVWWARHSSRLDVDGHPSRHNVTKQDISSAGLALFHCSCGEDADIWVNESTVHRLVQP